MSPSPFDLHQRTALVTGGGRGIGQACALALGQAGAHVLVVSRSQDQIEATATQIRQAGGQATPLSGDMGSQAGVDAILEKVKSGGYRPDILLNAAGISPVYAPATQTPLEEWDRILQVNLSGTFYLTRAIGGDMAAADGGAVITVTSIGAQRALPRLTAYNASKAGLDSLTRTLAAEWASAGVRVNSIAPAYIQTEMTAGLQNHPHLRQEIEKRTPMGRFGRPEEVGWCAVFLASEAASYITGHTLAVDGGWTCV